MLNMTEVEVKWNGNNQNDVHSGRILMNWSDPTDIVVTAKKLYFSRGNKNIPKILQYSQIFLNYLLF